jgi:hypothetical protein
MVPSARMTTLTQKYLCGGGGREGGKGEEGGMFVMDPCFVNQVPLHQVLLQMLHEHVYSTAAQHTPTPTCPQPMHPRWDGQPAP